MRKTNELDEMEQAIVQKSAMCAYQFILIILSIWIIVGLFLKVSVVIPGYILIGQFVVRFAAEQIYKREVGDERWKHNIVFCLIGMAVIMFIALLIPFVYIGAGEM